MGWWGVNPIVWRKPNPCLCQAELRRAHNSTPSLSTTPTLNMDDNAVAPPAMSSAEWNATLRELTVALDASGQQQIPIPTYRASHPPRTAKQPNVTLSVALSSDAWLERGGESCGSRGMAVADLTLAGAVSRRLSTLPPTPRRSLPTACEFSTLLERDSALLDAVGPSIASLERLSDRTMAVQSSRRRDSLPRRGRRGG